MATILGVNLYWEKYISNREIQYAIIYWGTCIWLFEFKLHVKEINRKWYLYFCIFSTKISQYLKSFILWNKLFKLCIKLFKKNQPTSTKEALDLKCIFLYNRSHAEFVSHHSVDLLSAHSRSIGETIVVRWGRTLSCYEFH